MAPLTTGVIQAILREFSQQRAGRGRYGASGFSATGGTITYAGGKTIHIFTSTGTFSFDASGSPGTIDYLVVGGGGGGSQLGTGGQTHGAGGGGAGGLRSTVTNTGGGGTLETA